ncbi:MAG: hypothetical protein A3F70_06520 [Acidobacteria bacterium RIFCSPLOWO2_12_FULL_67_14]|nr:MAG: hypothetical protein A3H29_09195 [Acidobacteria bacterium RIFCSPLOWO2_02_FULL_67_21]OFW37281.1 MAG: hypothetical protein A3F70_06520 [Acidobacteria bacterium RIFCSPLOWO2_12_FULL_67_14]
MTRSAAPCGVLVLVAGALLGAQLPDRAQSEAQAKRVGERIRTLEIEADRLAREARTLLGDLRALEVERQLQIERVAAAEADVARGQQAVDEAVTRLQALEQQRVAQLPDLKTQLVDVYKRGPSGYAKLLFGTTNVREFSRAARAAAALMHLNQVRVAEHRRTLDRMRGEGAALEDELRTLRTREADARRAQTAADRALAARSALIAQIDARRDLNAQLAGELQIAQERLQQQMASLAAGRTGDPVAVPLAPFRGTLDWPAAGRLAVRFGQASGRAADAGARNGIEIAAPEGTPVRAIHPGTVSYADAFAGFGNLVIVDHGANAYTLYGYLSSMSVRRGAVVDAGTELGSVGAAPAGPAGLYFEVRVDGRSVDPLQWLKPAPAGSW